MEKEKVQSMGKRIAALRKNCGFTQEQLAEKLGVSPQAVSKWENDISCPDISLIPLLASTLGVSTDELLGVKPIEPHVVVVETEPKQKKHGKWNWEFSTFKADNIVLIVMLLLVGVVFLLGYLQVINIGNASFWGVVWPLLLIGLGVSWTRSYPSPISIGIIAFGAYSFLFNLNVVHFELTWGFIWPAALILIALSLILRLFLRKDVHEKHSGKTKKSEYNEEDGRVVMDCSFGNEQIVCKQQRFQSADLDISFGDYTLDLRECTEFVQNAMINVDVSFGSLSLLLPKTVRVINSSDKSFSACSTHGEPQSDALYSLYLRGDISFGSVDIRYE